MASKEHGSTTEAWVERGVTGSTGLAGAPKQEQGQVAGSLAMSGWLTRDWWGGGWEARDRHRANGRALRGCGLKWVWPHGAWPVPGLSTKVQWTQATGRGAGQAGGQLAGGGG